MTTIARSMTSDPRDVPLATSLCGRDLICFSHDWSGDPLSKTHLMRLLARNNRILWVNSIGYRMPTASRSDVGRLFRKIAAATEPIREVEPNIFVFNPLAIPAYGSAAIRGINQRWLRWQIRRAMRRLRFKNVVNWVFNPAAGLVAGRLGEQTLVYYCVDEYTAFSGVASRSLAEMEQRLLQRADLVIVSADKLYHSKSVHNSRTVLVRHGVQFDHFRQALSPETTIPNDIAALPRPILGYFGLMSEDWVDLDLLVRVAKAFPAASLVLLGKSTMDLSALERLPNVHLLGRKPFESLPGYCKAFDVALIPFPVTDVTLNANPLKAREYLAAGLPVISTAIPEVEILPECHIAGDAEEFITQIRAALVSPGPSAERSDLMRGESWEARLDAIRRHFHAAETAALPQ